MKKFTVEISESAIEDIKDLSNTISYLYKAPLTSKKYVNGLFKEIKKLESSAESLSIQTRKSLSHFGHNVRRLNYKKMAVIYTVYHDTVYIHRIIPANTIAGL